MRLKRLLAHALTLLLVVSMLPAADAEAKETAGRDIWMQISAFEDTEPEALSGESTTCVTDAATVDQITAALEDCDAVILDSHGLTDYTDPPGCDYTVTFSVLGDTSVIAPMVCNTLTGITLPDAEGPQGYRFLGWVEQDYDNVTAQPETVLTGLYTAQSDITLLALFTYNDYGGDPPTLALMTTEDTFSDGDKIVIVESGGVHGLYQKAHNYAYVSNFAFTEDAEAILADELQYFNVTKVDGGWYLGDETNGWLYTPDNQTNLTIRYNTAFMTAFTLTTLDGHLALQHTVSYNDNVFYVNCGTNLTGALTNKWRMVNANNMTGVSTLDIYKLHEGGPASARYTTVPPHVHTPGEPVRENETAPTCLVPGGYDSVVYCSTCGEELSREYTEIPATGHDWNEPTYVWAEDYSEITATRICKNDASHVETEQGAITSEVTKEATEEEEGEITYTATFTNPGFETQVRTVTIPMLEPQPTTEEPTEATTEPVETTAEPIETTAEPIETTAEPIETTTEPIETTTEPVETTEAPKPPVNPFVDVKEGAFYYDAVLWAVNADPQVTAGTSTTTFSPNATCTRAQVVTFLWRVKGSPEPEALKNACRGDQRSPAGEQCSPLQAKTGANPFQDVKEGAYYYKAVLWAVENGITVGTSATTFSPNAACTRAQVVTFLWRTEGCPEPETLKTCHSERSEESPSATDSSAQAPQNDTRGANPFTDVTGGYYYTAVLWAVERKITAGTSATTFSPNAPCTRGQIVTFLWRAEGCPEPETLKTCHIDHLQ